MHPQENPYLLFSIHVLSFQSFQSIVALSFDQILLTVIHSYVIVIGVLCRIKCFTIWTNRTYSDTLIYVVVIGVLCQLRYITHCPTIWPNHTYNDTLTCFVTGVLYQLKCITKCPAIKSYIIIIGALRLHNVLTTLAETILL